MYTYVKGKGWLILKNYFIVSSGGKNWRVEQRDPVIGEQYSWYRPKELEGTTLGSWAPRFGPEAWCPQNYTVNDRIFYVVIPLEE